MESTTATVITTEEAQGGDLSVITTVPGFMTCADLISKLRAKYDGVTYDVSTTAGMDTAVAARKELRDARIALDKKKPEVKREALDFCAKVEADYKAIRSAVLEYEDIPDKAIKDEEARKEAIKAEKARIAAEAQKVLDDKILEISKLPLRMVNKGSQEVADFLTVLEAKVIGGEFTGETRERAEQAKAEALVSIRLILSEVTAKEQTAARLEYERKEQEQADKLHREAMAAQQAELDEQKRIQDIEAARLKKLADEEAAKLQAERAAFEAEKKAAAEKQAAIEAEAAAKQAAIDAENKRIADEAAAKQREEDKQAAIAAQMAWEKAGIEREKAEKARKLAEAKCADAATAFQKILDICNDKETLSPVEALAQIAIIAEGNL